MTSDEGNDDSSHSPARPSTTGALKVPLPPSPLKPQPTAGLVRPTILGPSLQPPLPPASGELAEPPPPLHLPFKTLLHISIPDSRVLPLSRTPASFPNPRMVRAGRLKQKPPPLPVSPPGETTNYFFAPHQVHRLLVTSPRILSHPLPHFSFTLEDALQILRRKGNTRFPPPGACSHSLEIPTVPPAPSSSPPTPNALMARPSSACRVRAPEAILPALHPRADLHRLRPQPWPRPPGPTPSPASQAPPTPAPPTGHHGPSRAPPPPRGRPLALTALPKA